MIFSGQAMNVYWLTTNLISMSQSRILKIKPVREKFGIGELKKWNDTDLPMNQMSLFGYVFVFILNTKNLNQTFGILKIIIYINLSCKFWPSFYFIVFYCRKDIEAKITFLFPVQQITKVRQIRWVNNSDLTIGRFEKQNNVLKPKEFEKKKKRKSRNHKPRTFFKLKMSNFVLIKIHE